MFEHVDLEFLLWAGDLNTKTYADLMHGLDTNWIFRNILYLFLIFPLNVISSIRKIQLRSKDVG